MIEVIYKINEDNLADSVLNTTIFSLLPCSRTMLMLLIGCVKEKLADQTMIHKRKKYEQIPRTRRM